MHSIVVPRLIRNKSLTINLTKMTEKINKNFRTNRICILKESRRIITNRCRNDSEYGTKNTNALAYRSRGRAPNKKSERETGRTHDSFNGRITYSTRNTFRNRYNRWFARAANPVRASEICKVLYRTVRYLYYGTVRYGTAPYQYLIGTVRYHTGTVRYRYPTAVRYGTVPYGTVQLQIRVVRLLQVRLPGSGLSSFKAKHGN
jgi:hypothetical protein